MNKFKIYILLLFLSISSIYSHHGDGWGGWGALALTGAATDLIGSAMIAKSIEKSAPRYSYTQPVVIREQVPTPTSSQISPEMELSKLELENEKLALELNKTQKSLEKINKKIEALTDLLLTSTNQ